MIWLCKVRRKRGGKQTGYSEDGIYLRTLLTEDKDSEERRLGGKQRDRGNGSSKEERSQQREMREKGRQAERGGLWPEWDAQASS